MIASYVQYRNTVLVMIKETLLLFADVQFSTNILLFSSLSVIGNQRNWMKNAFC